MGRSAYDISVRETLQNRAVGLLVAAALIATAIALAIHYHPPAKQQLDSYVAFYSDDDGQTYFKDSIYKFPPFDHNGKTADMAVVCTDGKRNFVTLLERYTPHAQRQLQDFYDAHPNAPYETINLMASPSIFFGGVEVKVPGKDQPWIARSSAEHQAPATTLPDDEVLEVVRP